MAEFKSTSTGGGRLSAPDTDFTERHARGPYSTADERDQMTAQLATAGIKKGGEMYARKKAEELTGAGMSQAEVNTGADVVQSQIDAALTQKEAGFMGPLSPRQREEIKDAQLSKYADNDRTLLELRDRGVISTTEARGRRMLNLQRELSNPINAMFRNEFMDVAKDITGGSDPTGSQWDYTPEEKEQLALAKAEQEAKAAYEKEVVTNMQSWGTDRVTTITEMRRQEEGEQKLAELERIKGERELRSFEAEDYMSTSREVLSRSIAASVVTNNSANQRKGLNSTQMTSLSQTVEMQASAMRRKLDSMKGLPSTYKDAELARIDKWVENQNALIKTYDSATIKEKQQEELKYLAKEAGWHNAGGLMALEAAMPKLYDVWKNTGGRLDDVLNLAMGPGKGTKLVTAMDAISDMQNFATGERTENPEVLARIFGTSQTGYDVLNNPDAHEKDKVDAYLTDLYTKSPEEGLGLFLTEYSSDAANSPSERANVDRGMQITRRHIDWLLESQQTPNALIELVQEPSAISDRPSARMNPKSKPALHFNMPKGMEEHAPALKAMYKVIERHPWMWEHVQDEYMDATDAFNGYLRGEWDVDVVGGTAGKAATPESGIAKAARATRAGRVEPELEVRQTALDGGKPLPRVEDVQALKDLIAQEEAGTLDDETFSAHLEKIYQENKAIREKSYSKDTGAMKAPPVSPFNEQQFEQPAPVQVTGKFSTDSAEAFTMQEEHPEGYMSEVTQLDDGSIGAAKANRDGKAYPYAIFVEGKGWEVDRGYGERIADSLSEKDARALVKSTPPIPLEEAQANVKQHLDEDRKSVDKAFPGIDPDRRDTLAMMEYQGAKITGWPNTSAAVRKAIETQDPADFKRAQAHMLNSVWATQQTEDRALRTVHRFYPDTPIEELRVMLEAYKPVVAERIKKKAKK